MPETPVTAERAQPTAGGNRSHHRAAPKLFPLQALYDATGFSYHELMTATKASGHAFGVAVRHGLTAAQADTWAVRCRLHPASVWGDDWYRLTGDDAA